MIKLLVLEGAQGGGKSTLFDYLIKTYKTFIPADPVATLPRPRSMVESSDNGAYLSLMTDLDWFLTALKKWSTGQTDKVFLLDRHVVSQWVYRGINHREALTTAGEAFSLSVLWGSWMATLDALINQYYSRHTLAVTSPAIPKFHFAFYQPSLDELIKRRSHDISKYPFDPRKELERYSIAAKTMKLACPTAVYTETMTEEAIGEDIHATLLGLPAIQRDLPLFREGEGTA